MAEQVTIQITENKTINVSDVLGNLKISTAAPTTQGLYMLSEIGTYTNLGGLVAEAGKVNYAYFDGSAWSLVGVELGKKYKLVIGKNKVNPDEGFKGFILNTDDHPYTPNVDWHTTGKIPVTGNMIANHSIVGMGIANLVFGTNGNYLRRFDSPNYTYQNGDDFVEYSYKVEWTDFQVENGDVSTIYEPYTDKADILQIAENKFEPLNLEAFEIDVENCEIVLSLDNGGIGRKFGFDIPSDQTGANSYIQVRPFSTKIQGSFKVDVIVNSINHDSYLISWGQENTDLGKGCKIISKTFTNVDELLNIVVFPNNLASGQNRYFRISKILIKPLDLSSKIALENRELNFDFKKVKKIEISKGFDSTTNDFGVSRFNNIITAWEADSADYLQGRKDRKTIFKVMPSVYNEFETKWHGSDSEPLDGTYFGIIPRNNQFWKSYDVDFPELTELHWDGHAGFSSGFVMDNATHVMRRAIFHISDWEKGGLKCGIEGFKIWSKNTRYCVHPESAGTGFENEWFIKNCLIEWQGRPNGTQPTGGGTHIGIGISAGEKGLIKNVKLAGISGGIGGHNNGWSSVNLGAKPFVCIGANLTIENCDLNGGNINFQTISNDANVPDSLIINQSSNIDTVQLYTDGIATQNWMANIINSDVQNDLT